MDIPLLQLLWYLGIQQNLSNLLYLDIHDLNVENLHGEKKSAACDTHCFPAKFGSQDLFILMAAEKYSPKDVYYNTEVPVGSLSSVLIT